MRNIKEEISDLPEAFKTESMSQFQVFSPPSFGLSFQLEIKRLCDLVLAVMGLLFLSPFLLGIALAIRLDSSGPVLFKAQRVGKHGKVFIMYKFRTMYVDAQFQLPELAHLNQGGPYMIRIPDDPRVTRLGKFLRRTSLDELPQLLNVVKGEMSLVGPRPQAPNEVALYTLYQRQRLIVMPGITGLWQVTSHHIPNFEEWVNQDLKYITQWSLLLDAKILVLTIGEVLKTFIVI